MHKQKISQIDLLNNKKSTQLQLSTESSHFLKFVQHKHLEIPLEIGFIEEMRTT